MQALCLLGPGVAQRQGRRDGQFVCQFAQLTFRKQGQLLKASHPMRDQPTLQGRADTTNFLQLVRIPAILIFDFSQRTGRRWSGRCALGE